ncbi:MULTISPECIES: GTP cyclohydrolase I FolE [unclassified Salinivibrio]|uniref:GTP cyclohydrolase I FolE n=1 Tax=unclassified Salinivibrio TaxID=2636825 RepID=UPI0006148DF0|nr:MULTISPECIES: GTP cyclohydrolase I FolE [unclassified Salinivibrio]MPS31419.1 GTP cyclohydrolase I FolE [Salinivibrio sp. VYel7]MPX90462.1 GTP cyclohydrolase I FolE [Salinivibrio sp. VYel1]MPX92816.1 GTP cyclohydrolase I FolE [Salinivibrio sp. VYel9]MPX95500.1 GTP cyclohydrolase I FolE [Salinivibrio sp. VYel6]MPX99034.1 GTP cyclohydrolase I FolE [Salinivibrio sp. VYel4]MPY02260.1 GTP cyclohydrolase I FolE [Salinivibrio sp. VYel5]MPY05001.1 GTP cyclohydrolase I FolE [Salinivibrio sp. VYel8
MMALSDAAKKVQEALVARGIETPMTATSPMSSEERKEKIEFHMREILQSIDLDLTDDSLAETPARIAKMYVDEIFSGLDYAQFPKVTMIENKMGCDEMVRVKDISVTSTCEHHLVTIDGRATVAYLPNHKVLGLSKINRIVRFFSQRPQVQERLTRQVLVALQTLLETEDVAVRIEATHYCVKSRGVMDANSETTTTALGGLFKKNAATRAEFLHGIQ